MPIQDGRSRRSSNGGQRNRAGRHAPPAPRGAVKKRSSAHHRRAV
jgi:hypothetical protein